MKLEEIEAEARRLAEENPNKVYKSVSGVCTYRPTLRNRKGCLIGAALNKLNYTKQNNKLYDNMRIQTLLTILGIETTHDEAIWLKVVQEYQDNGYSWGQTVVFVDTVYA